MFPLVSFSTLGHNKQRNTQPIYKMILTVSLVCFSALVMSSVAIYITSSMLSNDIAKIISVPDVLFIRKNFGLQNFKAQYLIYKTYHESPLSKKFHDISFVSDTFCWFSLSNYFCWFVLGDYLLPWFTLGNYLCFGISTLPLLAVILQVIILLCERKGNPEKDLEFTITAIVSYTALFLLSLLCSAMMPAWWELVIIFGLFGGTSARVFGHNEESLIPPRSFSFLKSTDDKFGPKAERGPYFLAGIFALPICAGAEFMSGIPGRLSICVLYDHYCNDQGRRSGIFGWASQQIDQDIDLFKKEGLKSDIDYLKALSSEPCHHYNENDEIPSTWKAILMVEPIIISLCTLPQLMNNFDSNISSHQNLMLLSVMAWFFVLLNYLVIIHYPSVRLVSGIQKANLFFNLWVIGVMLANSVLLSNVLLFHLQLCVPLLCTAIRLIFLHSVAFDSGIMHKDVMHMRKN